MVEVLAGLVIGDLMPCSDSCLYCGGGDQPRPGAWGTVRDAQSSGFNYRAHWVTASGSGEQHLRRACVCVCVCVPKHVHFNSIIQGRYWKQKCAWGNFISWNHISIQTIKFTLNLIIFFLLSRRENCFYWMNLMFFCWYLLFNTFLSFSFNFFWLSSFFFPLSLYLDIFFKPSSDQLREAHFNTVYSPCTDIGLPSLPLSLGN